VELHAGQLAINEVAQTHIGDDQRIGARVKRGRRKLQRRSEFVIVHADVQGHINT